MSQASMRLTFASPPSEKSETPVELLFACGIISVLFAYNRVTLT